MKKMSRFRKWLIRKLGGYTEQEIRIVDKLHVKNSVTISDEFIKTYGYDDNDVENYVRSELYRSLYAHIKRQGKITKVYNPNGKYTNYFITLELENEDNV